MLIHILRYSKEKHTLRALLQERRQRGGMSYKMKMLVLDEMRGSKSLEYVRGVLKELEGASERKMAELEEAGRERNYLLRLLAEKAEGGLGVDEMCLDGQRIGW